MSILGFLQKWTGRSVGWRFLGLFVLPNIVFAVLAITAEALPLISILNLVVITLAVNICIAFAPSAIKSMFGTHQLNKVDFLTLGIFSVWFSIVLGTGMTLVWRYLGEPSWVIDNNFNSYRSFMLVCAAVFHLASPGSIHDAVPSRRWIKIGAWIAAGVFAALLLLYASDVRQNFRLTIKPHDHGFSPSSFVVPL